MKSISHFHCIIIRDLISVIPEWSSGFPYFLQFKSEFRNKEFMIWATVSSSSCFCWLYRASPSLAAKNIINLISVLTIWWCPCVDSSLVLLEEGVLLWPVHFLGKTLLVFALLHSSFQGQICQLLQVFLDFLLLHSTIVWPQVNSREGTQLHQSTENWFKDLLSMSYPSEQDTICPSVTLFHQEASTSFLSFSIRGADRLKTIITEN